MQQEKKEYDFMFKMILVGVSSVGKSAILCRFAKNIFDTNMAPTQGVQYASKVITTENGSRIKLQIWDTAGQQRYKSLMKTFYRGSSAAIVVFDVTREDTFLKLQNQLNYIDQYTKTDIIKMIVGNKIDDIQKRIVPRQRGLDYAQSKQLAYYEVSALDGTNIELIFTKIAEELDKAVTKTEVRKSQSLRDSKDLKQKKGRQSLSKVQEQQLKQKEKKIVLTNKSEQVRKQQSQQKKKCCS